MSQVSKFQGLISVAERLPVASFFLEEISAWAHIPPKNSHLKAIEHVYKTGVYGQNLWLYSAPQTGKHGLAQLAVFSSPVSPY